jgi:hypothetical protein
MIIVGLTCQEEGYYVKKLGCLSEGRDAIAKYQSSWSAELCVFLGGGQDLLVSKQPPSTLQAALFVRVLDLEGV